MNAPLGTCRVIEREGRWHIAKLTPTGLFGLGPPKWEWHTLFGHRTFARAQRRADRIQRKSMKWHAEQKAEREQRARERDDTDAAIRRALP